MPTMYTLLVHEQLYHAEAYTYNLWSKELLTQVKQTSLGQHMDGQV